MTLDFRSKSREFDFRSGSYQVVNTGRVTVCTLQTVKPCRYITNTKVDSAFYLSGIGRWSTGLLGWG